MTSTSFHPPLRLLIAGESRGAAGRNTGPVFNPANGLVLGALPHAQTATSERSGGRRARRGALFTGPAIDPQACKMLRA